jgi:hypothetical protein
MFNYLFSPESSNQLKFGIFYERKFNSRVYLSRLG